MVSPRVAYRGSFAATAASFSTPSQELVSRLSFCTALALIWECGIRSGQHFPAITATLRYDLRGYGGSSAPADPYSHVDDFIALTGFLKSRPAHLVGLSLGGRLALRVAAQMPTAVRSLTLVDTALDGHDWSAAWSQRWRAMIAAAQTDLSRAKQMWLEHDLFEPARARPAVAEALDAMIRRYSGWHFQSEDPGVGPSRPIIEMLSKICGADTRHCRRTGSTRFPSHRPQAND